VWRAVHGLGISFPYELGAFTKSGLGAEEGDELEVVTAHHLRILLAWRLLFVPRAFATAVKFAALIVFAYLDEERAWWAMRRAMRLQAAFTSA
jgi:hypothetical protein